MHCWIPNAYIFDITMYKIPVPYIVTNYLKVYKMLKYWLCSNVALGKWYRPCVDIVFLMSLF